jgi:prolyl-tRNA editing enzyme YbaK/EbsC (Cys-tRNA(Pro) deacylase)
MMFERIRDWLNQNDIEFREVHHPPTYTSEESARARGENISTGGKALVVKIDDSFRLFVLSAAKKVDSNAMKKRFGAKKLRFANPDELMELTGLVPGSVPPFGPPITDLQLIVDESITLNEKIAFNAGSLTDSIIMSVKDYLRIAEPEIMRFSR